ncbi:electron transfer flavoprotein-ubiquinone oxidoreductase [Wohlfahrtiimonas populi]|uniref:electron transfer flavoprotein-ubiquinone oxidoreductase n=1 Tax=Wohlfahrtiimonas populi TaxID=1940240 RepID=UPI00098D41D4|nr:electron transfer flavoprotein-ubiquinone oxidoreductase [Wohlfahrtiimonas populi]
MARESMMFDVVIVGAGPAGLSAAIRLKQEASKNNQEISVCVVEKGSEVGAHTLSGAVLDTKSLSELFPDWQAKGAPVSQRVTEEKFLYLTEQNAKSLPVPPSIDNKDNYIISLGVFMRWLAKEAEALGVEIYPGFAASEILYDESGAVRGIATGDMGLDINGEQTSSYMEGMELYAQQIIFAEGCRGSLSQQIIAHFHLDQDSQPQTYGIGIKEVWEVDSPLYNEGEVVHTVGWPLEKDTYGGTFIYHLPDNKVALGMVVGLDYENPYLSPFEELQRFKLHPKIKPLFENGRRIAYGARALIEGGIQSLPKLTFNGGVLVGDAAGFLNVPRIKGIHMAMKSGMLAADSIYSVLAEKGTLGTMDAVPAEEITQYSSNFKKSWAYQELWRSRNIRPAFKFGFIPAILYAGLEDYILKGRGNWTFKHKHKDNESLKLAKDAMPIHYPKPDGKITFDRSSSVYLSGTNHRENQPVHLKLKDITITIDVNHAQYASPETRYCPAGVYEILLDESQKPRLQINAQNCVHCKTCDIKDPQQNIVWCVPEGGDGPNYAEM